MNPVFVDTSAIYALLVASDAFHARARDVFETLRTRDSKLVTTSYVLVESYALLQRRVGSAAVDALREGITPLLDTIWVGAELHESGLDDLSDRLDTSVSLVDAVSFAAMRRVGAEVAFTFDADFAKEGIEVLG